MTSGIIQILIAAVIVVILFKIAKNIAKTLFIALIVVAAVIFLKGVVDWAMIESMGMSFFEWIGSLM
ncbi:MAG: hypothetical protein IJL87_03000 [Clostridia bacterium]|nr:hypothetical protein [Clostridia bacterium]